MSDIELFSTPLCPFAHRARLVLAEGARLPADGNPPQRQARRVPEGSPYGKVPAFGTAIVRIWESAIE